jgi:glyoxylase-like metal-dependent hydrolase (beta-lactamase superfamily II)
MSVNNSPVMIKPGIGYFPGAVNVGLILGTSGAILIDSGLDAQSAKKIKKSLDSSGYAVSAIVQTHAHADHFGGNAHLLAAYPDALVYAPPLEEAVMRYPVLEPIYLGMGATPIPEMKNKFLMAEPSRVDRLLPERGEVVIDGVALDILPLPGHSWNQVGVVCERICFAADSYFGKEVLDKHKLPFQVDAHETLLSLVRLMETSYEGYLPGHGMFERTVEQTLTCNIHRHRKIMDQIQSLLSLEEMTLEQVLARICDALAISIDNMTSYVLYRAALMGYLTGLLREERIRYQFENNCLLWSAK